MQTNIFGEVELNGLTIEKAAKIANVSTATIRNWIKTGYLIPSGKGVVSRESLEKFISEIAGKEKLNARANKTLKDKHDQNEVFKNLKLILEKFKGERVGIEYENSLSDSHRNREGVYYTPTWVVKDMFKNIKMNSECIFLDPCCGSGNFLIEAIRQGIAPENVFGFDVDENAVLIARRRIMDDFGYATINVKVGDFLQEAYKLGRDNFSFDFIFTNPPWGKKIEKAVKERYSTIYGCGNSLDTTSLFFSASISLLKPNGFLGFLIQEAFFNITTFEVIRKKAIEKRVLRFVDYGKAFKGLVTKAQAIIIQNIKSKPSDSIECCVNNTLFERTLGSFVGNPKHIFNFWVNEDEAQVINQLYSVKHITLKGKSNWALGIVTGNNERFCTNERKDGYIPVFKGADIHTNRT